MAIDENDIIDFYEKYDEDNRMSRKPLVPCYILICG